MKHAFNTTIHSIGIMAVIFGMILAVRAAGLADLGGDYSEMVKCCELCVPCFLLGALLYWWRI